MTSSNTMAPRFHWGLIFLSGFSIILLMILAHFLFVAAYAYLTVPGKPEAFYVDFARETGTAFAVILGPIIAFAVGHSVAVKSQSRPLIHALITGLTYLVINSAFVAISGNGQLLSTSGFLLVQILILVGISAGALTHISSLQKEDD